MPKHVVVPLIVACALFMQQLDTTALATSLPAVAAALGEHPVGLHLVLTSYMFSLAAFLPVSGWVADRFGARRIFRLSIVIFTLSSVACGMATNFEWMIGARVVQGLGGAMMVPVGRLILVRSVDKKELVRAIAVMSMPALVGPILGPLIGGFLTTYASWRWIFWVNLPIGIIGIIFITIFIEDVREFESRRFDLRGVVLSSVGLCGLLFGLDAASAQVGRESLVIGCIAVGVVALVLYIFHARRATEPVLDLALFKIATFRASVSGGSLFRAGAGALPFLLPMLFQEEFGYTPFQSGLVTFVSAFGSMGMRTISSRILKRFGFRNVLLWNGWIAAVFLFASAFFRPTTPYIVMISVLFFGGVFRSLSMMSLNALAFADVSRAQMSHATSFSTMAQRLSQSIGIAVAAFILHAFSGPDGIPHRAFVLAFGVIAGMSIIATLSVIPMDPNAGAELSGRTIGGGSGAKDDSDKN